MLLEQEDPVQLAAGWELTAHQVVKAPELLDLEQLLDTIEAQMLTAPDRLQWAMNTTLAQIGIENEALRPRALAIGESLQVLADYPTSAGCVSPFAPIWITEMVKKSLGPANAEPRLGQLIRNRLLRNSHHATQAWRLPRSRRSTRR